MSPSLVTTSSIFGPSDRVTFSVDMVAFIVTEIIKVQVPCTRFLLLVDPTWTLLEYVSCMTTQNTAVINFPMAVRGSNWDLFPNSVFTQKE